MTNIEQTENESLTQSNDWAGRFVSLLAVVVCLFGVFVLGNYIVSRPAARILVKEELLTKPEQQFIARQLANRVEGNFFTANIHTLKDEVSKIDWVKAVSVSRQWPDGLVVEVVPRHPVARFGSTRFLSQDGTIFQPLDDNKALIDKASLPMIYGPDFKTADMMQQYRQVNAWFEKAGMQIKEISLTDRMTWFFKFDNGMRVIVDRENAQAKLFRLSILSQTQLQSVWAKVSAVDLRYRNGMAVLWKGNRKPTEFNQAEINRL